MDLNANIEVRDREGMTLLQTAAWNGHEKVVILLPKRGAQVEARDREGWTSLHHASWNGHATVVQMLLQKGADVNAKNNESNTPLYHATWNGHLEVVKLLLQGNADVNERCTDGETTLQQAAWRGHIEVATVLIEAGADLNIRSRSGRTALHDAATNGQQDMVDLLLRAGADSSLMTEDGQTAFEAAKENSYYDVARYLESQGGVVQSEGTQEEGEPDGMNERRTGLGVDPAITALLNLDSSLCTMQGHGDACSSEPFKITAMVDGEKRFYFTKICKIGEMFEGEYASLKALHNAVPSICPLNIGHGKLVNSDDYFLLTEFLDVNARTNDPASGLSFAQKLAALHKKPAPIPEGSSRPISWADFYATNRLHAILGLIEESHGADEELRDWIEKDRFNYCTKTTSRWLLGLGGKGGLEEVAFDASCCYAHSEYELGLMRMFGGFSAGFFSEYHRLVPKTGTCE
ncbi:hypothetical protein AJ80_04403 [Polytolypa hystricis UAMH7299]|uniref:Uncharacterized protein n=1 Tax=Polytolypa hystricis (strain UAMH7299) TaxID=1447883 RepID=A0A2B7YAU1_POLH7|nr:hypothetical protein AJ80_04403 [Polytolypa hystricis UAMH7299]